MLRQVRELRVCSVLSFKRLGDRRWWTRREGKRKRVETRWGRGCTGGRTRQSPRGGRRRGK
jgi:hypothetical protein